MSNGSMVISATAGRSSTSADRRSSTPSTAATWYVGLLLQYRGTLLSDVYEIRTIREPTLQVLGALVSDVIREGDHSYAETHDWQHEQQLAKVALRAHTRLVELIRTRNGDEAEDLWRKHLAESAKIVLGDRATTTVVELLS